MNKKFLLCILSSSNEKLLKLSYLSALNQTHHNIDYNIIIIVNSINPTYFNSVKKEFDDIDVEIIETLSNGKPGMGHNSVINLFKNRLQYDYMLLLDGDDFLYPSALEQLTKCFDIEPHIDMLMMKSTDKLKYLDNDFDLFDVQLNNNFTISSKIYVDYKLYPWNKEHMKLSNFYNNTLCTPLRLFLLNRNIFNFHSSHFFHTECSLYDDYLTFLYFIRFSQINTLKCFIIPGKYIYLYNSINLNSVTHNSDNNDIVHYNKLKNEFLDCKNFLGESWNLTKLPTLYITHKYDISNDYNINDEFYNITMNMNYINITNDKNYSFIKKYGIHIMQQIIESYYDIADKFFKENNYEKALFYSKFFYKYKIINYYIYFIIIYSISNLHTNTIDDETISLFNYVYPYAKPLILFYNIPNINNYCKIIKNLS